MDSDAMPETSSPSCLSFADEVIVELRRLVDACHEAESPGTMMIDDAKKRGYWTEPESVCTAQRRTAFFLLLTVFGAFMRAPLEARRLKRRLSTINGRELAALVDEYAPLAPFFVDAFLAPAQSRSLFDDALLDMIIPILDQAFNNHRRPPPEKSIRDIYQEVQHRYRDDYLAILRPYRELALRRPDLIPELRRAAQEAAARIEPDDPLPTEAYALMCQDIEALLDAVETGEIGPEQAREREH